MLNPLKQNLCFFYYFVPTCQCLGLKARSGAIWVNYFVHLKLFWNGNHRHSLEGGRKWFIFPHLCKIRFICQTVASPPRHLVPGILLPLPFADGLGFIKNVISSTSFGKKFIQFEADTRHRVVELASIKSNEFAVGREDMDAAQCWHYQPSRFYACRKVNLVELVLQLL